MRLFWQAVKTKVDPSKIDGIEYPEIGSRWIRLAKDGNPWGEEGTPFVEIFDVKDGWVRFGRQYNGRYSVQDGYTIDKRLRIEYFFVLYQKYIPFPEKIDESK